MQRLARPTGAHTALLPAFRKFHTSSASFRRSGPPKRARFAAALFVTGVVRVCCMATDPDGFNPTEDTVGAGIYGGRVKRDANGNQIWGQQYCNHCRGDGPVYDGTGYTEVSNLIHRGDHAKLEALLREQPHLVNEQMTGGATPLHVCGMSKRGQLAAEVFIRLGADLNGHDTCGGYTPLGRMASNNLAIGAEALLKAGARWDIENNSGDTPLATAQMSSAWDVVEVLQRYGAEY